MCIFIITINCCRKYQTNNNQQTTVLAHLLDVGSLLADDEPMKPGWCRKLKRDDTVSLGVYSAKSWAKLL